MEEDRILSKSKLRPSSSKPQEKTGDTSNKCLSETNDNCSESSLDGEKMLGDSSSQSSSSNKESGASNLPANIQPIDEKEILQNRLSLEQIKEIPKFMNYHPGEPNKVRCFALI